MSPLLMTAKTCSFPALASPTLVKGSPFVISGHWEIWLGMVVYGGGLGFGGGQGGGFFSEGVGVSFARPHLFHVVITGRVVRGCIDVSFLAGC